MYFFLQLQNAWKQFYQLYRLQQVRQVRLTNTPEHQYNLTIYLSLTYFYRTENTDVKKLRQLFPY